MYSGRYLGWYLGWCLGWCLGWRYEWKYEWAANESKDMRRPVVTTPLFCDTVRDFWIEKPRRWQKSRHHSAGVRELKTLLVIKKKLKLFYGISITLSRPEWTKRKHCLGFLVRKTQTVTKN